MGRWAGLWWTKPEKGDTNGTCAASRGRRLQDGADAVHQDRAGHGHAVDLGLLYPVDRRVLDAN